MPTPNISLKRGSYRDQGVENNIVGSMSTAGKPLSNLSRESTLPFTTQIQHLHGPVPWPTQFMHRLGQPCRSCDTHALWDSLIKA